MVKLAHTVRGLKPVLSPSNLPEIQGLHPCGVVPLGDKQLRHCLPFAAFRLYCHLPLLQDALRLVKRRRALRERNPPRNSQLETHRTDEAAGGPARAEQANQALGRLDGLASILPDPSLFIYLYVRNEAVLSSQIEGTQSSFSDLMLFESEAPGVPLEDVQEVSNYDAGQVTTPQ
jgi:hypothetical protein